MPTATPKRGTEMPMIDCCMIVVTTDEDTPRCIGLTTASKLGVEKVTEDTDPVKLVVKNVLYAQKPAQSTVTGHTLTLTDNVLILELLEILEGGKITKDESRTITGYTPPVAGEKPNLPKFTLDAYSAQYDASGSVVQYEKISYPNCTGNPIGLGSEDNVFRINEYKINSAPAKGEAPYVLSIVDALPVISES